MIDRETLEKMALDAVCACLYYELTDTIEETSDEDLQELIQHSDKHCTCDK